MRDIVWAQLCLIDLTIVHEKDEIYIFLRLECPLISMQRGTSNLLELVPDPFD